MTTPLGRPEDMPPVRSAADLYDHWQALMGPLGFSHRRLWVLFLDADGRVAPVLPTFDYPPARAGAGDAAGLLAVCAQVLESIPHGSAAVLYSRPGGGPVSPDDRSWARTLAAAALDQGVRLWPTHVANDTLLQVVAPDDLLTSA